MIMYLLFITALLSIVGLMISLWVLKMPGHKAVPAALVVTIVLAILAWNI